MIDRDGPTHEVDESTVTTRPHTCPQCGTTRSRPAVPYLVVDHSIAQDACAACGAQFESWTARAERRAGALASARPRGGERENVREPDRYVHRRGCAGTAVTDEKVRRRTLTGRGVA
jgi:hypothetical protein